MKNLSKTRFFLSLSSLLSLFALPARAGDGPYRLADINPGRLDPIALTDFAATPADFFRIGNRLLFSAANRNSADEGMLWSTDGTPGGTMVVSSSLCPVPCQRVAALGSWHGLTFLEAISGVGPLSSSLWRTDGTSGGTIFLSGPFLHQLDSPYVLDLHADPEAAAVFFTGCDPRGCRLWRSDGTPAGTGLVRHPDSRPFDSPRDLTFWRGRLYFLADHTDPQGNTASGLWSTDGTPAGTFFVADVQEGDYAPLLVPTPSHLFFTSGPAGEDLWVTGGGPGDARRLYDFPLPPCSPRPESDCDPPFVETLAAFGDAVYFEARRDGHGGEIWRSDGTEAGTGPVLEVPGDRALQDLHPLGGRWIFTVSPPGGPAALWTADAGFTQGSPLAGCPEGCPAFIGSIDFLANGSWLFAGADAAHGTEPWVTDGTGPGTRRLADACPGTCDGIRMQYNYSTSLGGTASRTWFHAYSSADEQSIEGDELWVTDGTPDGTRRITGHVDGIGFLGGLAFYGVANTQRSTSDLWAADASGTSHRVAVLRRFGAGADSLYKPFRNGALLLAQREDLASELWKSDGTPAGTAPLYRFEPGPGGVSTAFLAALGRVQLLEVFRRSPGDDPHPLDEIWRTDGVSHTQKVAALPPGSYVGLWTSWQGRLLYEVAGGTAYAFWTTDGTAEGTREILPLPATVNPTALTPFGSRFLFVAQVQAGKQSFPQLFISDGTPAGTRQISAINQPRELLFDDRPVQVGGTIFFRLNDPSFTPNAELWRTDGTLAGTRRAATLSGVDDVYVFRGALYFTAILPDFNGRGLYRMTPGGTPVQLAQVATPSQIQPVSYPAARLTPVGDRLLFVGTDRLGIEPWITDGTPAGTHPLLDIQPGLGSSNPASLISAGARAFFSADDGTHGRELWETGGTPEGTRMVQDIAPGGLSALPYYYFPGGIAVSNGFLYFNADDGTTGPEPWALRLEP
jgi:ELWxxDGT repeat protein